MEKFKDAVLLTAPAGRISQEIALLDLLISEKNLTLNNSSTYLAGMSSGALNLLAINACFGNNNTSTWKKYKEEFVFKIENDSVFVKTHPINWHTLPFRKRIKELATICNIDSVNQLPFRTDILTYCNHNVKTYWINSRDIKYKNTNIVDALMAAAAVPVFFPPQRINGSNSEEIIGLPESSYADAYSASNFKRFKRKLTTVVRSSDKFENLYILSPMRQNNEFSYNKFGELALDLNEAKELKSFSDNCSQKGFLRFLYKLRKQNKRIGFSEKIFVCIPTLRENYNLMDFNNQEEKYNKVIEWGKKNPRDIAVPLNEYLDLYDKP